MELFTRLCKHGSSRTLILLLLLTYQLC